MFGLDHLSLNLWFSDRADEFDANSDTTVVEGAREKTGASFNRNSTNLQCKNLGSFGKTKAKWQLILVMLLLILFPGLAGGWLEGMVSKASFS